MSNFCKIKFLPRNILGNNYNNIKVLNSNYLPIIKINKKQEEQTVETNYFNQLLQFEQNDINLEIANNNSISSKDVTKPLKIVFVVGASTDPFYKSMLNGAMIQSQFYDNVTITMVGDPNTQISILQKTIDDKPDGIILDPTDPKKLQPLVDSAVSLGIPVININSSVTNLNKVVSYIRCDDEKGGIIAADTIASGMKYSSKQSYNVVVSYTSDNVITDVKRLNGFQKQVKLKYPKIKIIPITSNGNLSTFSQKINELFAKNPKILGVFAIDGISCTGMATTIKNKKLQGKIILVGYNAYQSNIELIKSNIISALISQNPAEQAKIAVETLINHINSKPNINKNILVPAYTINKNTSSSDIVKYGYGTNYNPIIKYVNTNSMNSLNPGVVNNNTNINSDISSLCGISFDYYDNNGNLIQNTNFGSYTSLINADKTFSVTCKINPNQKWSDGTPIDAIDLLLSHVISSNKYSIDANLGDPSKDKSISFNSLSYNGLYNDSVIGLPQLSADKMSLTITFKSFLKYWKLFVPGPSPVHTLVHLMNKLTGLQNLTSNIQAKQDFYNYFINKNTEKLTLIGNIWSNSYNINEINDSTNPLLLVGNGGYIINKAIGKKFVILGKNPNYTSGPKFVDSSVEFFKVEFNPNPIIDSTTNFDIYLLGSQTIDQVNQTKSDIEKYKLNYEIKIGINGGYSHIDLRVASADGKPYTGPFAQSSDPVKNTKALDLRKAFLLAVPRQEIIDKIIKPINPNVEFLNTLFIFNDFPKYNEVVKNSGVSKYIEGTQADRTNQALKLVQKYYPNASSTNQPIQLKLLVPGNSIRRKAEAELIKAELAKAGFEIILDIQNSWAPLLRSSDYDIFLFGWSKTTDIPNALFYTKGGNNLIGYSNPAVDKLYNDLDLETDLTSPTALSKIIELEKNLIDDAVSLRLYYSPVTYLVNKRINNFKPPIYNPFLWNYWELSIKY